MAKILSKKLRELSEELIVNEYHELCTNMVFFEFKNQDYNKDIEKVEEFVDFMQ